jgi:hypothetical protein
MRHSTPWRRALLAAGVRLVTALPAWANAPDPELYPELAAEYGAFWTRTVFVVLGVIAVGGLLITAGIIALIVWLVKRNSASHVAGPPGQPPAPPAPPAPPPPSTTP